MVLNAAAGLVVGTGKFSQVIPILRVVLHWLLVQHRISCKIAILAQDCIHSIGPAYFGDVCAPVTAAHRQTNLSSATCGDLVIPRTRTKLLLINHFLVPLTAVTSGQKKIVRTEFPYIRTDGVELTPVFAQTFCYKPRTFPKRTENIVPV